MKYKVIVEEEPKGGYSVYAPQLPGCASQGETRQQALRNIKKAIRLYLWSLRRDRRLLEKRKISIQNIAA